MAHLNYRMMILKFGKFKGQELITTPVWYQDWLQKQDWFYMPKEKPLHQQLNGWDGYSRKGQAVYDAIWEQEQKEQQEDMCREGCCSCCEDSIYYGW